MYEAERISRLELPPLHRFAWQDSLPASALINVIQPHCKSALALISKSARANGLSLFQSVRFAAGYQACGISAKTYSPHVLYAART
jgi:hypothetical protein